MANTLTGATREPLPLMQELALLDEGFQRVRERLAQHVNRFRGSPPTTDAAATKRVADDTYQGYCRGIDYSLNSIDTLLSQLESIG